MIEEQEGTAGQYKEEEDLRNIVKGCSGLCSLLMTTHQDYRVLLVE